MPRFETYGVVQDFDYSVNLRHEVTNFDLPKEETKGELAGRTFTPHCCQIVPPNIIERLKNPELHFPDELREGLEQLRERLHDKAHLHTEARDRRHAAAVAPARALKAINYTVVDAKGNEDFNDDVAISDFSTNETAARLLLWSQRTMDFLKKYYNRNGIDNMNMGIKAFFNYGVDFENAFWDGSQFFCGNGGKIFDDFSQYLDVVAHELNHGVNQFINHFVYKKQNGALDESFADVAGILVKHLYQIALNPGIKMSQLNSKIGEGLVLPNDRKEFALRDMATGVGYRNHPILGTDACPIKMSQMGKQKEVHTISGIPNKLFWHIYTHQKLAETPLQRIAKVTELYSLARVTLNSDSTFATWGSLLQSAADKRYGRKSTEADIVREALKVTEIRL